MTRGDKSKLFINAMGGIKSNDCNDMTLHIWQWANSKNIWLSSCHLPGVNNVVADQESRNFDGSTEWSLNMKVFEDISNIWGPFQIDLFASRLNYKVQDYVSWKPDPGAKFVNAFHMNWANSYFYCFPPFSVIASCLQKNRIPRGNRSDTDPSLANPAMVHNVVTPSDRQTSSSPPIHQSTNTTSQRCSTPLAKATSPVGLQSLRQGFLQSNISGKATEIILHSWSVGTQKQYQPYLRRWFEFCGEQQASPYSPSVTTVLDFLVRLHEQGLTYTTLNTARSAISALTVSTDRTPIGSHPIVSRFMKGIYKCTPPMPRYQSTWDVQPVLSYLSGLSPMEKLDLKTLTLKVTMLVALVSAKRSQILHMLNINFMKDTSSCFEFVLPAHIKQSRPGYRPLPVMLHAYPHDKSLCVYSYLTEYLKRTQPLRGKETQLFLSFTRPHKAISKETLSRWIRTVMSSAGIDVASFKPHSTRSASTSKAKAACIPMDEILRTAGWSSSRSFDRFYDKPVQSITFASAVLHIE